MAAILACSMLVNATKYEPTWESLDSRPLPAWYDEGKIGIFIHWGAFSVPGYGNEWFWYWWKGEKLPAFIQYMQKNYPPNFTYADFGPLFKARFYSPSRWADIFKAAGAKYVVLVTKHHEGFCNWPSKYSWNWNAGDVGPNRDLVGELADAVRNYTDLKFGVYHSLFEFFNPLYLQDEANGYRTQEYVRTKTMPELYELVNTYKPEVIWSDGDWMASDAYWNSTNFLAWLYNESPVKDTIVVNDRWGNNTRCKHGGYWNCKDKYTPGKVIKHKWEKCATVDKYSWGYRHNTRLSDYVTIEELLQELVPTISFGGNFLLNIGPTSEGEINVIFEERLRQMGSWLEVNGDAIYKTSPWTHQNDTSDGNVWYTAGPASQPAVYAIILSWPKNDTLQLAAPVVSSTTKINMLGYSAPLKFQPIQGGGVIVNLPSVPANQLPCKWAWTLKFSGLKNEKTNIDPEAYAKILESIQMMKKDVRSLK